MELTERLNHIRRAWLAIKEQDPQFIVPGAAAHQYQLLVDEDARRRVEFFEANNGFTLPEEYREYLIQVSNGGPCPFGLMYSLQDGLTPLNRGKKGEPGYYDWLEENLDHYVSEFPVTEEQIIGWLRNKMAYPSTETAPLKMEADEAGYVFICSPEPGKHYIMPVNGACSSEVWLLTEISANDGTNDGQSYVELRPVIRFVNDQLKTLSFLEWIEDAQQNWFNDNVELDLRLNAVKFSWFNLAAHDKNRSVFGAFMHHYKLNPTLTEEKITDLEKQYGFSMPNEYRQYLKIVGNGGVGPYYGMYSFETSLMPLNSGSRDQGNFVNYMAQHPDHFTKAFPVSEQQIIDFLNHRLKHPNGPDKPIVIPKDAGGYLFIAEYGCGGYYVMPLNGPVPGQIWFLQKRNANKLTYELANDAGEVIQSGSYGSDEDDNYFDLYPEAWMKENAIATVNFTDWVENAQRYWFYTDKEEPGPSAEPDNEQAYYPLAVGNTWTYDYNGQQMVTGIESCKNGEYTTSNSLNPASGKMKKKNGEYFNDGLEKGNMQLMLKDQMTPGDRWEAKFKANGLDCVYVYTVKEVLKSKTVHGKEYHDVVMVEIDSCYIINGARMSMNAFTQNYYARGIGVILTTTSGVMGNNSYPLLSHDLK